MKKFLMIVLLSAAMSVSTMATAVSSQPPSVDLSGLTPAQVADLAAKVDAMKKEPTSVSAKVRGEAEAWGSLGSNMGKAMVGAAREVGVAANDFASTDLGKITVGLVVYKLVGKEVIRVVVGIGILFAGFFVLCFLMTTKRIGNAEYERVPMLFGLWQKKVLKSYSISEGNLQLRAISCAFVVATSLLVGLQTIL